MISIQMISIQMISIQMISIQMISIQMISIQDMVVMLNRDFTNDMSVQRLEARQTADLISPTKSRLHDLCTGAFMVPRPRCSS
jgi:hypothetical protein